MLKLKAFTTVPSQVVLGMDARASYTLGKHSTTEIGYRFPVSWLTLHSNSSPRVGKHKEPCLIGCFGQRAVMVRGTLLRLSFSICGRHCFLHLISFSPQTPAPMLEPLSHTLSSQFFQLPHLQPSMGSLWFIKLWFINSFLSWGLWTFFLQGLQMSNLG